MGRHRAGSLCRSIYLRDEMQQAPAPEPLPFGVNMLGPVHHHVRQRSAEEALSAAHRQSRRLVVPGLLGAGRRLRSRFAEDNARSIERRHYIVNGQKTWTTLAQYADMIFCLVRTDPTAKGRRASSFLLVDMNTPGVKVRPILTIDGDHEVNEVFFDDVRVPADNLSARRTRAGTTRNFCSATSAPVSPASASPRRASAG